MNAPRPPASDDVRAAAQDLLRLAERGVLDRDPGARRAAGRILTWAHAADAGGLEAALGGCCGWQGLGPVVRGLVRDALLDWLADAVRQETAAGTAAAMAAAWAGYASRRWPRDSAAGRIPADDPARACAELMRAGHQPLSAESLRRHLRKRR